jgi:hypothetical protein
VPVTGEVTSVYVTRYYYPSDDPGLAGAGTPGTAIRVKLDGTGEEVLFISFVGKDRFWYVQAGRQGYGGSRIKRARMVWERIEESNLIREILCNPIFVPAVYKRRQRVSVRGGGSLGLGSWSGKGLAAGAFSLGERPPVLAESLEPRELVVIEFDKIAGGAVVQELENIVHDFASALPQPLREECTERLQGSAKVAVR